MGDYLKNKFETFLTEGRGGIEISRSPPNPFLEGTRTTDRACKLISIGSETGGGAWAINGANAGSHVCTQQPRGPEQRPRWNPGW